MPINPIGGGTPLGGGGFPPTGLWPAFQALVARFWMLLEAGELAEAEVVLAQICRFAMGRAAMWAIYEECAAALAAALGGLGGGGIIICLAIVAICVVGAGTQPAYAEEAGAPSPGGGRSGGTRPVIWRPSPIRRSEEWEEVLRMILANPQATGKVITAQKLRNISAQAQKAAIEIFRRAVRNGV